MSQFVSANDILNHAKIEVLAGRDPVSKRDWTVVLGYAALVVDPAVAEPACQLLNKIWGDPLTGPEVCNLVGNVMMYKMLKLMGIEDPSAFLKEAEKEGEPKEMTKDEFKDLWGE